MLNASSWKCSLSRTARSHTQPIESERLLCSMDTSLTFDLDFNNDVNSSIQEISKILIKLNSSQKNLIEKINVSNAYNFYETEQLATLWFLLVTIVLGNLSVLLAQFLTKRRKSRVNFFIAHLAFADILVGLISVLTDLVWRLTVEWKAGNSVCKLVKYSQVVVTYSSTYVLVALSIDRYDAIKHPMNFSKGLQKARVLVLVAWLLSCLFSSPVLILFEEKMYEGRLQCWIDLYELWHWQIYVTVVFLTLFFFPALIIASCYAVIVHTIWAKSSMMAFGKRQITGEPGEESKRVSSRGIIPRAKIKTIKMTLVIVFAFIASWSPYMIHNLLQVYELIPKNHTALATFIQSLAPINSAVNPMIYWCFSTYMCRDLRRKLRWLNASKVGTRITDTSSLTDSAASSRRTIQLQNLNLPSQKPLLPKMVDDQMVLVNGLSANAKAFSVEKLIEKDQNVTVELCSPELWETFNNVGTEMIITKAGRRMFPTLKVRFHGLSPSSTYIVYLVIKPIGASRLRYLYHSSKWVPAGPATKSTFPAGSNFYIHPDSPASGTLWTSQAHITFDKIKLTNNERPVVRGQVSLNSMHKYQPHIRVLKVPDDVNILQKDLLSYILKENHKAAGFSFPETTFVTVTAYQNQEMTRLKIRSNPFAKGFRDVEVPRFLSSLDDEFFSNNEQRILRRKFDNDKEGQNFLLPAHRYQRVPIKFVIPPSNNNTYKH